jgi:hypothetical protein
MQRFRINRGCQLCLSQLDSDAGAHVFACTQYVLLQDHAVVFLALQALTAVLSCCCISAIDTCYGGPYSGSCVPLPCP